MPEGILSGRMAVVTQAGGGLGFDIARRFAQAGAHVVVADREPPLARTAASALAREGLSASFAALEPRDPSHSTALVDALVHERGIPDVWVNQAAGFVERVAAENLSRQRWEETVAERLSGVLYCCQAVGRKMLARGRGVIVNMTSSEGLRPIEGRTAEGIAAAALMALTRSLGVEWARRGVRVVGVAMGPELAPSLRRIPLRRPIRTEEVCEVVLFLASEAAGHVVAETLRADGGWSVYQLF